MNGGVEVHGVIIFVFASNILVERQVGVEPFCHVGKDCARLHDHLEVCR